MPDDAHTTRPPTETRNSGFVSRSEMCYIFYIFLSFRIQNPQPSITGYVVVSIVRRHLCVAMIFSSFSLVMCFVELVGCVWMILFCVLRREASHGVFVLAYITD